MNEAEVEGISKLQVVGHEAVVDRQIVRLGLEELHVAQLHVQDAVNKIAVSSEEERKIRDELELHIERDLEEEIKDGMRCLARRLQMLYKHKEDRRKDDNTQRSSNVYSELNIMIKLDGQCRIDICEAKPSVHSMGRSCSTKSEAKKTKLPLRRSKFDWSKTLRSGTDFAGDLWNNDGVSDNGEMSGFQEVARRRKWSGIISEDGKLRERKNNKQLNLEWKF